MLTGKPLEEILAVVGHVKATRTRELVAAARKLGCQCGDRLTVYQGIAIPSNSLVKVIPMDHKTRNWHWVAFVGTTWHDPDLIASGHISPGYKLSSYLEIRRGI